MRLKHNLWTDVKGLSCRNSGRLRAEKALHRLVWLRDEVCDERTRDRKPQAASLPHSIAQNAIEWGTPERTWATRPGTEPELELSGS